ncbi:hypothetical protein HY379_02405 [Candidatus Saccharibacteria bacterium]|nr:hypothetical protein [Candidatus Saccharibacteria bacterium]
MVKIQLVLAYLDPGTGSIVIQSIIGVVAGVGLFGRRLFINLVTKVKNFFGGSKKS